MENRARVLVADPAEDSRKVLAEALSREVGLELVGSVGDGAEALRAAEEKRPNILILDLVLPSMDGLSVMQELSGREDAPVMIVTSSLANEHVVSEAAALGARYFLPKPCDEEQLMKRVRQVLKRETKREPESGSLECIVTDVMHEIGIPAHIKGYQYLREAIMLTINDMDMINAVTKRLYPTVAERYSTTPSRVERAIRHAIEVAWDRGDLETLQKYFSYTVSNTRGKPTNSEFVAMIADRLRLQLKLADK